MGTGASRSSPAPGRAWMPAAAGPPALTTSCGTWRAGGAGAGQGCLSPEHPHRDPARAGGTHFLSTQAAKPLPARDPAEGQSRRCSWWTCWWPCCVRCGSHLCHPHRLPCSRGPGGPACSLSQELRVQHKTHQSCLHTTWGRAPALPGDPRSLAPHQGRIPGGSETQGHTQPDSSSCHSGAMNMQAAPVANREKGQTANETVRAGAHAGDGGCLLRLLCGRDTAVGRGDTHCCFQRHCLPLR